MPHKQKLDNKTCLGGSNDAMVQWHNYIIDDERYHSETFNDTEWINIHQQARFYNMR